MRNAANALNAERSDIAQVPDTFPDPAGLVLRLVEAPAMTDRPTFMSAPAVPDMPAAIGIMIVLSYAALLMTFVVGIAAKPDMILNVGIIAVFLIMFFAVPRIFLVIEPTGPARPTLGQFMRQGIVTATGHCSGRDALIQILIVPMLLTACALGMGIAVAIIF